MWIHYQYLGSVRFYLKIWISGFFWKIACDADSALTWKSVALPVPLGAARLAPISLGISVSLVIHPVAHLPSSKARIVVQLKVTWGLSRFRVHFSLYEVGCGGQMLSFLLPKTSSPVCLLAISFKRYQKLVDPGLSQWWQVHPLASTWTRADMLTQAIHVGWGRMLDASGNFSSPSSRDMRNRHLTLGMVFWMLVCKVDGVWMSRHTQRSRGWRWKEADPKVALPRLLIWHY